MKASEITSEQIQAIAKRLHDTAQNVYRVTEHITGQPLDLDGSEDQQLWDRLRTEAGIKKCEECNRWKMVDMFDADEPEMCIECMAECSEE